VHETAAARPEVKLLQARARSLALAIKREIHSQVGECLTSSIGISANKLLASGIQHAKARRARYYATRDPARLYCSSGTAGYIGHRPNMVARL